MPWHPAVRHREHIRKLMNGRIPERDPAATYFGRVIIERLPKGSRLLFIMYSTGVSFIPVISEKFLLYTINMERCQTSHAIFTK